METHHQQHQKNTENNVEKQQIEGLVAKLSQEKNEHRQTISSYSSSPPTSSQPSQSSSPSHEFSFTISLQTTFDNTKSPPPQSHALDLSPADEIFFHGHLLPLHFLSHLPSSPRSSTNSMDSFTLPIRELLEDENFINPNGSNMSNTTLDINNNNNIGKKVQGKSKLAFSLFGLTKKHKGCQDKEHKEMHKKKKLRFDVIHAMKKYLKMVRPRMFFFKGKREKIRHCYSYSGNVTPRNYNNKNELKDWKGQYSAPASMRTSPTNSGLLLATSPLAPPNDSTMEELQAAIQAAIAHCKNSIAKEEKLMC